MVDIKKLKNFIDSRINNIYRARLPYSCLRADDKISSKVKKQVLFLGYNFKEIVYLDRSEFIKKMNLCLDYIRQQCSGYDLYYKPHPNETDEYQNYNLESFKILDKRESAEIYFLKNIDKIDCVFAVASCTAINAYKLGINSYLLYKLFRDFFDDNARLHFKFTFSEMPQSAFIGDLNKKLIRYSNVSKTKDDFLLNFLNKLFLSLEKQKIWITINHPRFLLEIVSLTNLIKKSGDDRKVNLIISRHKTWKNIDTDYLKRYFDNIYFFPRHSYSLRRYKNLISLFRTTLQIKKLNLSKKDLIINFSPCEFIENMVISFFKKSKKITFMPKNEYQEHINVNFLEKNQFSFTRASFIFNKFIEPILGINRTLCLKSRQGVEPYTLIRYQRPLNKIYDYVFLYEAS